jgi:sugar/nucleoside kinase (ribokinase family)
MEQLPSTSSGPGGAEYDLLVVGRPSVDVTFTGLEAWPELGRDVDASGFGWGAGTSFNTPASANRLGLRVAYVSAVGTDVWGRFLVEEYEREGLPTEFLRVVDGPLPWVSAGMNLGPDRGFVTYAAPAEGIEEDMYRLATELVSSGRVRHLHGYISQEEAELARLAREGGMTVSLDAWGGPWFEADADPSDVLSLSDVVLANESEAMAVVGAGDLDAAMRALAELCPLVVVKRGGDGASALVDGRRIDVPTERTVPVDTTGAGDCFNAGFLYGWLHGLPPEVCLGLGNLCGGAVVRAFGGYRNCPTEPELLSMARTRGILDEREDR